MFIFCQFVCCFSNLQDTSGAIAPAPLLKTSLYDQRVNETNLEGQVDYKKIRL